MWQCPICGREFQNPQEDHFCKKTNSIDDYIAFQPDNVRPLLQKIREIIRAAVPEGVEKISWQMPTFWQGENLIHFAAFKNHIGCTRAGKLHPSLRNVLRDIKQAKERFNCRLTNR